MTNLELYSPAKVNKLLEEHDIHPKKSLGQNFLIDKNIIDKITDSADIKFEDTVIEIGPGLGTMTIELAKRAGQVVAIELDQRMVKILRETLKERDNVCIIQEDALELDYHHIISFEKVNDENDKTKNDNGLKIVANLPYYISSPMVLKLVKEQLPIHSMVFMLQKEVADRFTAKPGTKSYGAITVILNCFYQVTPLFNVPKSVFYPSPKVESRVIKGVRKSEPYIPWERQAEFVQFINYAFANRRKTLGNNLVPDIVSTKQVLTNILGYYGFDSNIRGEQLSVQEFAQIFKIIYNINRYSSK